MPNCPRPLPGDAGFSFAEPNLSGAPRQENGTYGLSGRAIFRPPPGRGQKVVRPCTNDGAGRRNPSGRATIGADTMRTWRASLLIHQHNQCCHSSSALAKRGRFQLSWFAVISPACRSADYVDNILRGSKPARPSGRAANKFDLVVNLITAKAIGLTVPTTPLVRADEVIQ